MSSFLAPPFVVPPVPKSPSGGGRVKLSCPLCTYRSVNFHLVISQRWVKTKRGRNKRAQTAQTEEKRGEDWSRGSREDGRTEERQAEEKRGKERQEKRIGEGEERADEESRRRGGKK